ncbi:MAG: hypothetical protein ACFCUN_14625 [Hyphomicrobiaceae bacterium]
MSKRLSVSRQLLAGMLCLAVVSPAFAETQRDCFNATLDVIQTADQKTLSDAQLKQIEDAVVKIEAMCETSKFADAAKARDELKDMIAKM